MRLIALMIYHPWCKFDMKLTFCNTIMFIVSVAAAFYFEGKKKKYEMVQCGDNRSSLDYATHLGGKEVI